MYNIKKYKNTVLYLNLLIFIFGSCSHNIESQESDKIDKKIIYKDILQPTIKMSELFNSYDFIALDASEGSPMIGEITKVLESNDRIVVFDREVTNSVFVYDQKGKFVFRTNKGDAPTETILIADFCIDKKNNNLLILDNGSMSIKKYNLGNGEYISRSKLKSFHVAISNLEDNSVLLSNSFPSASNMYDYSKVISFDLKSEPNQEAINYLPITFTKDDFGYQFLDSGIGFVKSDSTTLFSEGFGNEIFQISNANGSLLKSIEIDFGKKGMDKFTSSINSLEDVNHIFNYNNIIHVMGAGNARSSDKVIYLVSNGGPINYLFVDHDLSEFISYESIFNDLFPLQVSFFVGSSSNSTYSFFPPEVVANFIDNGDNIDDKLKQVIDPNFNIIRSNPILVKFYNQ